MLKSNLWGTRKIRSTSVTDINLILHRILFETEVASAGLKNDFWTGRGKFGLLDTRCGLINISQYAPSRDGIFVDNCDLNFTIYHYWCTKTFVYVTGTNFIIYYYSRTNVFLYTGNSI